MKKFCKDGISHYLILCILKNNPHRPMKDLRMFSTSASYTVEPAVDI